MALKTLAAPNMSHIKRLKICFISANKDTFAKLEPFKCHGIVVSLTFCVENIRPANSLLGSPSEQGV